MKIFKIIIRAAQRFFSQTTSHVLCKVEHNLIVTYLEEVKFFKAEKNFVEKYPENHESMISNHPSY